MDQVSDKSEFKFAIPILRTVHGTVPSQEMDLEITVKLHRSLAPSSLWHLSEAPTKHGHLLLLIPKEKPALCDKESC